MALNDLVDSFCHSQKNVGMKGLIYTHFIGCDYSPVLQRRPTLQL